MADTLTKWWDESHDKDDDKADFHSFQLGVTKGAVSMRERAMKAIQNDPKLPKESLLNKITNAVGSLPDIPTE